VNVAAATVAPAAAEAPLMLTIDIGSSSVRVGCFDRLGRALMGLEARRPLHIQTSVAGAAEADPDAVLELVWGCLDEAEVRAGGLWDEIAGVALCTFVGNVLGLDGGGRPITPLTTYADTRSAGMVAGLRADFDERETHERTGCHFHPCYLPARLRWYAQTQPEVYDRVARWATIGEYLELRLFGETAVTYSAAAWHGLLDREGLRWDAELLRRLPLDEGRLSPLTDAGRARRGLLAEFANRWPALAERPWFPAIGDGAAANVGSGCTGPGRLALTVGTTSAVRLVTTERVAHVPWGLWCYRVDGRRALPGGALSEGGSVFAWMRETLRLGTDDLEEKLAGMEPDAHGLTILPFWAGERSPGWAGDARATIHGLSLATTATDIVRAGLEAVAYRVALICDLLGDIAPAEAQVIASGGALLGSPAWLQIMADALGRPVAVSGTPEASARGAALLALEALGELADVGEAPVFLEREYAPDMRRHEVYRAGMERQKELYRKLVKASGG
jgi:gluconokinase